MDHAHFMITSRYWYFEIGIQRRYGLFWNKFNVSDFSISFVPRYDILQVIEGKRLCRNDGSEGKQMYFKLIGGLSYWGF